MTTFRIEGKKKGFKEVEAGINRAPKIYFHHLRRWMEEERAIMLGSKSSDKKKRRGYRDILANKPRSKFGMQTRGKWSKRVANLFKGGVPYVNRIGDLQLSMGLISKSQHQLIQALKLLNKGGVSRSSKFMPIPIYRNLAKRGYDGPWHRGSVKSGLKSKAFGFFQRIKFAGERRPVRIKSGNKILYFDPESKRKRGNGYKRSGLLFIGMKRIQVQRQLTGKYDFNQRWNRQKTKVVVRGQRFVDRATRKALKKKF